MKGEVIHRHYHLNEVFNIGSIDTHFSERNASHIIRYLLNFITANKNVFFIRLLF